LVYSVFMDQHGTSKFGLMQWVVRLSIAGLFGLALTSKLIDPTRFLSALQGGLGLSNAGAGSFFVFTVFTLAVLIALLLFRKSGLGLVLSGVFFIAGAAYSVTLNQHRYTGSCGCGVSAAPDAANQLIVHAYQNSASAVLCLFLGFRARLGGGYENEETNEED